MDGRHYGTALREARESRGLSISDVAKATRVPAQMLRQIEAGALGEALPAPVYVRGFIRAYARLLRLPEDQPLRLFDDASCALRRAAEVAAATPVVRAVGE